MKIRMHLLVTASSLALISGAYAADLPLKGPPLLSPVSIASWSGPYVGGHLGVVRSDSTFNDLSCLWSCGSHTDSDTGLIGGFQIGYNWQDGSFVYGVEADISWLDVGKTTTWGDHGGNTSFITTTHEVNWLSTLRGRAGLAVDRTLFYFTGGLAFADVNSRVGGDTCNPGCPVTQLGDSQTQWGWTAGVGIERMFNPNWTAKAEVLYVDLGRHDVAIQSDAIGYRGQFQNSLVIGRVGVNYKW